MTKVHIISPVYFSDKNVVGNEAEELTEKICRCIADNSYSNNVNRIFVFLLSTPIEILEKDLCFESVQHVSTRKYVVIQKRIDYSGYLQATSEERQKYLVANLLSGVKDISKEAQLDYEKFENDVLKSLDYTKEDIEMIY